MDIGSERSGRPRKVFFSYATPQNSKKKLSKMAHSFKITDPDLEKIKCLNHKATAIWKKKLNSPIHALVVGRGRCRCRCGAA